jgi:hypothetical protein
MGKNFRTREKSAGKNCHPLFGAEQVPPFNYLFL